MTRSASRFASLVPLALLLSSLSCTVEVTLDGESLGHASLPITGGAPATGSQLYATVALIDPVDETSMCTGTLVAPTVVVTAAHCIKHQDVTSGLFTTPLDPSEIAVAFALLRADQPPPANVVPVASVHATDFDGSSNPDPGVNPEQLGRAEDIGVLMLARPVTEQSYAAILPMSEVDSRLAAGSPLTIAGYGKNGPNPAATSGVLYIAETPFVRRNDFELVAGGPGLPDACEGDSGGPAYQLAAGTPYLVGATSRGSANAMAPCGEGGIWTLVPAYESWIAAQSGGAYPPSPPPEDDDDADSEDDDGCSVTHAGRGRREAWRWLALMLTLCALARRRRANLSDSAPCVSPCVRVARPRVC